MAAVRVGPFRWLRRLVVGAALVQLLVAASASASGRLPAVATFEPAPYQGHGLEVRPARINYSLTGSLVGRPTNSGRSGRLHWRSWTKQAAHGSGYDQVQKGNCGVLCPNGNYSFYPARIWLHRPRAEHGHLVFTRMTITYTKRIPPSHSRSGTLDLTFVGGAFNWGPAFGRDG